MEKNIKKTCLLLLLLTAALYGPTIFNGFVYDDVGVVFGNYLVRDWANFFDVISLSRGLRDLTYMFDYSLFGEEPLGYHLHSILWQMLAVLLVYFVSIKLVNDRRSALIITLLFACHPLHVEAVASIANRKEMLCFVFFMGSFLSYINVLNSKAKDRNLWSISTVLFFLLAYKSKEVAVTLPFVLLLYELCYISKDKRLIAGNRFVYPKVAFAVIILALASHKFSHYIIIDNNKYYARYQLSGNQLTYPLVLYNIITVFTYYVKNLLLPINLLPDYSPLSSKLSISKVFLFSFFFFVAYLYLIYRCYRKQKGIFFGLIWFLLNYLIVSPLNDGIYPLADRYAYLPSFGISLVIGIALNRLMTVTVSREHKSFYLIVLFVCLCCFSVLTINYSRYWKDSFTLWEYTLKREPNSLIARMGLAEEYLNKNMLSSAESELMRVSYINPKSTKSFMKNSVLSRLYYKKGDVAAAFDLFRATVKRLDGSNPNMEYPYIYEFAAELSKHGYLKDALGAYDVLLRAGYKENIVSQRIHGLRLIIEDKNRHKISTLKKAIIANPNDIRSIVNLGTFYYQYFIYDLAEREFIKALKINKGSFEASYNLGLVYKKRAMYEETAKMFENAISSRDQVPAFVYDNLGQIYEKLGREQDAIGQYVLAVTVQKKFAMSYYHLGSLYAKMGKLLKAAEAYRLFLKYWDGDLQYKQIAEAELNDLR